MSPEQTIGYFRVAGKLGEGGMGAVYRATGTHLNRDVAIKVLPAAFAEDANRIARFQREAQVLASLNHPNIAAIYGVRAARRSWNWWKTPRRRGGSQRGQATAF